MKKITKNIIPPILVNLYLKYYNKKYGWHGQYNTWEEAKKESSGYDNEKIIQKVRNSALKVKNGTANYERDSVIFKNIQYAWPLLAGLMLASATNKEGLKVLDFGGSLGTTYFQNKKFLKLLHHFSWSIVEQKKFVDIGKIDFAEDNLKFYYDIRNCIENENPNVLLLSSVLEYMEKPYELLNELLINNFQFILIDRTPFSKSKKKIKVQTVDPKIYEASYPCWFFSEKEFIRYFESKNYEIIESYETVGGNTYEYFFKGFLIRKINKY